MDAAYLTWLLWWGSHGSGHFVSWKRFLFIQSGKTSANWKLLCPALPQLHLRPRARHLRRKPSQRAARTPSSPPSRFPPAASMQLTSSLLMLQRRPSCLINCREIVCASGEGVGGRSRGGLRAEASSIVWLSSVSLTVRWWSGPRWSLGGWCDWKWGRTLHTCAALLFTGMTRLPTVTSKLSLHSVP